MIVKRTQEEIDNLLNVCSDVINDEGTRYTGMSYEQGIEAGIQ